MSEIRVKRAKPIAAEIRVPGDKSISHRAAMFAALANGPCEISGFLPSEDCLATVRAMGALGAEVEYLDADPEDTGQPFRPTRLRIHGTGMKLAGPAMPIDCGNSGTTMRLLAGMLSGQGFNSVLQGDESLSGRPMGRVIRPLEMMGAKIEPTGDGHAPLAITGNPSLNSIEYELPVASAQVKSAVLLAGMFAEGKTTVVEPSVTRDHTERMLQHFQVKTLREGNRVSIYGGQMPESQPVHVPGDISSAAFWLVAAAAQREASLQVHDVGLNPTRSGILQVLVNMGAQITDTVSQGGPGEPCGTITVKGAGLRGVEIGGDIIANVIDELPVIAVAAALAEGETTIRDAGELRVKETDRIAAVANNLRAFGVEVDERDDGMVIQGGARLQGARVDSYGDHRIAMAFAVAGLFASGETVIEGSACIATSYPDFEKRLAEFQSRRISQADTTLSSHP